MRGMAAMMAFKHDYSPWVQGAGVTIMLAGKTLLIHVHVFGPDLHFQLLRIATIIQLMGD